MMDAIWLFVPIGIFGVVVALSIMASIGGGISTPNVLGLALTQRGTPKPWAHGWETALVRATRYQNPAIGFNVGFSLPKHPYDCDRAEMIDWLRDQGVNTYSCGGYPGAEILAKIKGVDSKEAANTWLPEFLPRFDAWVRSNLN